MKKVYRKRLVRSLLVLIPLLVITGILLYIKLSGFKRALEQLVDAESSGQYSLVIGKSSVGISNLSFTFNDLTIRRNSTVLGTGIDVVHIPFLQIRFGSVASMLMVRQFDIESCIIHEPTIEINAAERRDDSTRESITISQQIVQLYPAVQALLGRFDIKSLKIIRASVGMNKPRSSLTLNLIDLLVEEWNIQSLTAQSQLQLKVGGQEIDFGKAALNFSGIEFNFRKHHLLFSDFNFFSEDTVSDSRILVSGESLVLQQLDYKDLYENKRYSIKKAQIDSPHVTVHFRLKKRDTTKVHDRAMLTRLLRHTVGECSVDSTIIRDARVHIVAQQDNDSVRIDLPRVNFMARGFKVTQDTSSFEVGEIEIDLNRTAIELKKDVSLHCDRIFFDRYQDLTLTKVVLFDSLKNERIATCEKLRLNYFNLLNYIFYKNILANTISLENANIQFTPDGHRKSAGSGRRRTRALNNVAIRNVSLKDVTVHYIDNERRLTLNRLSMFMTDLRGDGLGEFEYNIRNIQLRHGRHVSKSPHALQSQITDLNYDGRNFNVNEIDLRKDSLHIQIKDVIAENSGADPIQKNYRHWKIATLGSVRVLGRLSENNDEGNKLYVADIGIDRIKVKHLQVSLRHKKMSFISDGSDVVLQNLALTADGVDHGDLTGRFSNLRFTTPSTKLSASKVSLQYPALMHATDLEIMEKNLNVKIPLVTVHDIMQSESDWTIETVSTNQVVIENAGKPIFTADSAVMAGTRISSDGTTVPERLEIFKPMIMLPASNAQPAVTKSSGLPLPKQILMHPGILHLSNGKQLSFGKVKHNNTAREFTCAFVQGETEKMHIRLSAIAVLPDQLKIDSISLWPNRHWFDTNGWEDDLIEAELYGVHAGNFSIDHFFRTKSVKNAAVIIDWFIINVKRDKRRIDPPEKEKPATLSGLIKLPEEIGIHSIQLLNGSIRYTETSERTGAEGVVLLEDISATAEFDTAFHAWPKNLKAKGKLYNAGLVDLNYVATDSSAFKLNVAVTDFDLTHLNKVVVPLQSLNIKSGHLKRYELVVTADSESATGDATITYKDLHLEIFKRTDPEKKTLGTGLLTLLADGIVLKHSKVNAVAPVDQPRVKHKSIFNYWVKTAVHGAMSAIRKGKSIKHRKLAAGKPL